MGFPVAYTDLLMLPRALLNVVLLLGYLRRLLLRAFDAVGLGDLLDTDDVPFPETNASALLGQFQPASASAARIQEALPAVRFGELGEFEPGGGGGGGGSGSGCVVCLCEFEAEEEVRRLSNCRHLFHRGCLDQWLEHERRTCPLCRAPLLPGATKVEPEEQMWAEDVPWESYYEDFAPLGIAPAAAPSPTILPWFPEL
ncbi:brassinosteroid-responsive RING protein 1-like [Curcuma longa]|uniref:brassinosteroid-responsive RING protein 1-like n=1 Tax=Curcuma longa TaxID=136217 RepID=UPI003D9DBB62